MFKKLLNFKNDIENRIMKKDTDKAAYLKETLEKRKELIASLQY